MSDLQFIKIYAEEGVKTWEKVQLNNPAYGEGMVDAYKSILNQIATIEAAKQKAKEMSEACKL